MQTVNFQSFIGHNAIIFSIVLSGMYFSYEYPTGISKYGSCTLQEKHILSSLVELKLKKKLISVRE
jgi:hypothetical protein